jgi:hypothetical protein
MLVFRGGLYINQGIIEASLVEIGDKTIMEKIPAFLLA